MALTLNHVQIAVPAGGEAAARRFFGEMLELTELPKPAELAARGGCWFALGDRQLHLGIDPDFRAAKKAHIALSTDDLDALEARLTAAGYPIRTDSPVGGHRRFFTEDPFGNRLELIDTGTSA
ncbi:catechol 2,3-dioxygenase-like lactoylglutathione lyase family enzyme [Sphingomonas sp. UYAg733]